MHLHTVRRYAPPVPTERARNHARMLADRATLPATETFDFKTDAHAHGDATIAARPGVSFIVEDWWPGSRVSFFYPTQLCRDCHGVVLNGFCVECDEPSWERAA